MPKYEVLVLWEYEADLEVEVEADSEEEAIGEALIKSEEDNHLWENSIRPSHSSVLGITVVDEFEDEE